MKDQVEDGTVVARTVPGHIYIIEKLQGAIDRESHKTKQM